MCLFDHLKAILDENWVSNTLSLVAIGISLGVFLHEQKRENLAAEAARQAQIQQRYDVVDACVRCVDEALKYVRQILATLADQRPEATTVIQDRMEHLVDPILEFAQGLQRALPADADLTLTMARVCRTLTDLHRSRPIGPISTVKQYTAFLSSREDDLEDRRNSLEGLREPGSRLASSQIT